MYVDLGKAWLTPPTARFLGVPHLMPPTPTMSSPAFTASPGRPYSYRVTATDADGTIAQYQLLQSPPGMRVDEFGRISWQPTAANLGNKGVDIRVTDAFGESVTVAYNLSVVADSIAPKVNIIASKNAANVGESVNAMGSYGGDRSQTRLYFV